MKKRARIPIYLLIGFITLALSIICWIFILNTGSSLINGTITFGGYVKHWWTFSILSMLFFPVSVFAFINSFSGRIRHVRTGIALALAALSIGLCFLSAIMIPGIILDHYIPNRINGNLESIYVAVLIAGGLITGFCAASQTEKLGSLIRYNRDDHPSDDTQPADSPGKTAKYSYLEEYKARMKEGRK